MAHTQSAKKRIRQTIARTAINRSVISRVRTLRKKVAVAVESKDKEAAAVAYNAPYIIMEDKALNNVCEYLKNHYGTDYTNITRRNVRGKNFTALLFQQHRLGHQAFVFAVQHAVKARAVQAIDNQRAIVGEIGQQFAARSRPFFHIHAAIGGKVFRNAHHLFIGGVIQIQKLHCVKGGFVAYAKAAAGMTVESHTIFPSFCHVILLC